MPFFSQRSQQRPSAHPSGTSAQTPPPAGAGATTLFKRYRPLETRAAGGFGSVEICLDARLQRRVAIKRMPLTAADGVPHETTATALAEARTASMLQHPNIVAVIDFTYDEAYAYLVMEYVDGMSLEEFLAGVEGHSLTFDEAACIADALVQALSYAHENGVLHLDIKPANVLIDRAGHVKLTDFGMAALASSAGFGGARGGTVGYMPPEQLRGDVVDERADIFALAAVLYECLCANAPFLATTPQESQRRIERGARRPQELLPDLPDGADEALMMALCADPRDRMTSVQLFGERFLKRLGNAREGRKSLARIIARLASDDPDATVQQAPQPAEPRGRSWDIDPAEGYLGSWNPRARSAATGVVCALGAARALWRVLGLAQIEGTLARAALTAACAAASLAVPPLGSALALTGFASLVLNASEIFQSLPVLVLLTAFCAAWWYVWGREAEASAVLCACLGLACAAGDALAVALPVAALAGYLLAPVSAVATTCLALVVARLLLATGAGGGLDVQAALAALSGTRSWLDLACAALCAGLVSAALELGWRRYRDGRGAGASLGACAIPFALSIASAAASGALSGAALTTMEIAVVMGKGALASIMVGICVYTLGYRKTPEDGDQP